MTSTPATPPPPSRPAPEIKATGKRRWPCLLIALSVGCFGLIPLTGIVAALVIPNFIDALAKGRMKRTAAELQVTAHRLEEYRLQHGTYPAATTLAGLSGALAEVAGGPLEPLDAWRNPLLYTCWSETAGVDCDTYRLVSSARDGAFEHDDFRDYRRREIPAGDYDADLVMAPEGFLQGFR